MKGFTLFTGGGGVDIAMESLGVEVVGGIEYDDKIASVARLNGFKVTTGNILECNPVDFPSMNWLHASPPCPNFSVAKTGASETENDFALARKVAEWITIHKPRVFSLENVIAYRKSESWKLILNSLHESGYWVDVAHVNFADYGVPQSRKRMIVRAVMGEFVPYLQPTHNKNGINGLPKWIGWYEAIEDLIPTLPDSKFAPWQLKRLPENFNESVYVQSANAGSNGKVTNDNKQEPSRTVDAHCYPRAFIASQGSYGDTMPIYYSDSPHETVTANSNQNYIKAFVIKNGDNYAPIRKGGNPIFTLSASNSARAYTNGRVVQMTVQALARFQTFPDSYIGATVRIIGNAVPPVGMANVMRNLI